MKHYRTKLPRTALGLMAVAMSVITFGTLVVLPAQQESACSDCQAEASARAAVAAGTNGGEAGLDGVPAASAILRAG